MPLVRTRRRSITLALDRWRAGTASRVCSSVVLDVLASVPDPREPRGRRYPPPGCWRSRSWRPAAVCAGMPVADVGGHAPAEVLSRLGTRFDDRRRRSGPCCRGWTRQTWIAGSGRTSRQWPPPRRWPPAGCWLSLWTARRCAPRARMGAAATHLVAVFARRARLVLGQLPSPRRATNTLRAKASPHTPESAAAGHGGRHAHPDTTAKLICGDTEIALPMIVKSRPAQACWPSSRRCLGPIPTQPQRGLSAAHGRIETAR